jgi:mRNA interferase RelE/StbE
MMTIPITVTVTGSGSKWDRGRIVAAVEGLREDPHKGAIMSADWKGFRRLRVGSYRVIYAHQGRDLMISVVCVGHRREENLP